jgi:hypothetical protein
MEEDLAQIAGNGETNDLEKGEKRKKKKKKRFIELEDDEVEKVIRKVED